MLSITWRTRWTWAVRQNTWLPWKADVVTAAVANVAVFAQILSRGALGAAQEHISVIFTTTLATVILVPIVTLLGKVVTARAEILAEELDAATRRGKDLATQLERFKHNTSMKAAILNEAIADAQDLASRSIESGDDYSTWVTSLNTFNVVVETIVMPRLADKEKLLVRYAVDDGGAVPGRTWNEAHRREYRKLQYRLEQLMKIRQGLA